MAARALWNNLDTVQAGLLGALACLFTGIIPGFVFGDEFSVIGFITLFPFFGWLTLKAFFVGPFFYQFFFTKHGMFCVVWHLTFMFFAWAFFGLN